MLNNDLIIITLQFYTYYLGKKGFAWPMMCFACSGSVISQDFKKSTLVASVATSTYGVMSCYELLFSSDVHWRYVRACYVINLFFNLLTELIMTGQSHTKDKLSV